MTFENQIEILKQDPLTESLLDLKKLYIKPFESYKESIGLTFSYEIGKKFEILPDVDYVDDTQYGGCETQNTNDDDQSETDLDSTSDFDHPGVLLLLE